jgi:hypothetical protein
VGRDQCGARDGFARRLPEACVQIAPNADRAYVAAMLAAADFDLIACAAANPGGARARGARAEAGACRRALPPCARVRRPREARSIVANAKMRRTGICGDRDLLIDRAITPGARRTSSAICALDATSAPMRRRATSCPTPAASEAD